LDVDDPYLSTGPAHAAGADDEVDASYRAPEGLFYRDELVAALPQLAPSCGVLLQLGAGDGRPVEVTLVQVVECGVDLRAAVHGDPHEGQIGRATERPRDGPGRAGDLRPVPVVGEFLFVDRPRLPVLGDLGAHSSLRCS